MKTNIQKVKEDIIVANKAMKDAIQSHSQLCNKLKYLENIEAANKTIIQQAEELRDGHSMKTLHMILDAYFEVMKNKAIGGIVIINDLEALQKDPTVYATIIANCGGKLLYDAFNNLLETKTVDGEKVYKGPKGSRTKFIANKKKFARRMRQKEVYKKLIQYGVKCDLIGSKDVTGVI